MINNISHNKLIDIIVSNNTFLSSYTILHNFICFFVPKGKINFLIGIQQSTHD